MKRLVLLLTCFFILWTILGVKLSMSESLTFDEPVHIKAGLLYGKGIYDFDPMEPPLVRQLVVSLAEKTHLSYRVIVILINGVLISILLAFIAKQSLQSGIIAGILFLLEPSVLAHGHYFTTDMVSALLTSIGIYMLLTKKWQTKIGFWSMVICLGLAASAKVASLSLIVPLLLWKVREIGYKKSVLAGLFGSLIVWATYSFRFDQLARQINVLLPLGGYLRALKENLQFAGRGQPLYFWGQIYTKGPWFKQILVLLLKTSLPLWGMVFISLRTNPQSRKFIPVFIVGLVIHTLTSLHFGIRHMLPLVIFLIVVASQIKLQTKWIVTVMIIGVLWQIWSLSQVWPQPIIFANEIAGSNAIRIFSDSDFDWGQGLVELKSQIDQLHISRYQLAYFGNVDPHDTLGNYMRIKDENPVGSLPITKLDTTIPVIISQTCYYMCGYYQDPRFSLAKAKVLAHSFLYFHD